MAIDLSGKQLLAILVIGGIALYAWNSGYIEMPGQETSQTNQQVNQNVNQDSNVNQDNTDDGQTISTPSKPEFQLSSVKTYVKDKANPTSGISGLELEVLGLPYENPSRSDVIATASDPDRQPVDSVASTGSDGNASLSGGSIFVNRPYIYSLRGDSTVYDKVKTDTIGWTQSGYKIDSYTFKPEDYIMAYQVGSFSDMSTDSDNVLDTSWGATMNVSGDSGSQYVTAEITLEQADAGKFAKNPVLVLRSPEGYQVEPGDIDSLYISKKSGTSFGIPTGDLSNYVQTGTPIKLSGAVTDEEGNTYMSVSDSGTYTVKMTFDASNINPADDKLEIRLDDLGDYRGRDDVTRDQKISSGSVTFKWEN